MYNAYIFWRVYESKAHLRSKVLGLEQQLFVTFNGVTLPRQYIRQTLS